MQGEATNENDKLDLVLPILGMLPIAGPSPCRCMHAIISRIDQRATNFWMLCAGLYAEVFAWQLEERAKRRREGPREQSIRARHSQVAFAAKLPFKSRRGGERPQASQRSQALQGSQAMQPEQELEARERESLPASLSVQDAIKQNDWSEVVPRMERGEDIPFRVQLWREIRRFVVPTADTQSETQRAADCEGPQHGPFAIFFQDRHAIFPKTIELSTRDAKGRETTRVVELFGNLVEEMEQLLTRNQVGGARLPLA